jgi:sugar O-acyltransferase (sialic acid O-acetyltransferase NeuD family)
MSKLAILGSSANCLDILDAVRAVNAHAGTTLFEPVGFLDDVAGRHGDIVDGLPVLGPLALASEMTDLLFVNGIGSWRSFRSKNRLIERLGIPRERFATIVHPHAVLASSAVVGAGTIILGNTTLCANVRIGSHVMMLPNCVVGHDSRIGDFATLAAGVMVSGCVGINKGCYIGAGASIRDHVTLGDNALLGMGAVLLCDMPAESIFAGNPARPLVRNARSAAA